MFESIIRGLLLGLGLSFMLGSTFIILFNISIHKGFKYAISFILGVFLSDILIFSIVFGGLATFYLDPNFQKHFTVIGGIFIIIYGLKILVSKSNPQTTQQKEDSLWFFVVRGLLINLLNPMAFIFWLGFSTIISQTVTPLLTTTVALTTMLIADTSKAYLISKFGQNIKRHIIVWFNISSAIIMILIGIYFIYLL